MGDFKNQVPDTSRYSRCLPIPPGSRFLVLALEQFQQISQPVPATTRAAVPPKVIDEVARQIYDVKLWIVSHVASILPSAKRHFPTPILNPCTTWTESEPSPSISLFLNFNQLFFECPFFIWQLGLHYLSAEGGKRKMCRYVTLHFREMNIFLRVRYEVLTLNSQSLKSDLLKHNVTIKCNFTFLNKFGTN